MTARDISSSCPLPCVSLSPELSRHLLLVPGASGWQTATSDNTVLPGREWTRVDVVREVAGSLAMAVQRGNAMAFLEGYERVQAAALAEVEHAHRNAKDTKEDEGEEEADGIAHTTEEEDDSGKEEGSEQEEQ